VFSSESFDKEIGIPALKWLLPNTISLNLSRLPRKGGRGPDKSVVEEVDVKFGQVTKAFRYVVS
jgi:hypothetical protein